MSFLETVERARAFLERNGRVSLRALQREFNLDDDALGELIEELVEIQRVAVRDGSALAWAGGVAPPPTGTPEHDRDPRNYTPKHLVDKILRSKSALEGERKQVTVLFADVKGSMELAEQLDLEQWHAILDRFFQILSEGVHRFEGTINQYTGDGIMALFGAPIAHEDHAQRACYAALHLRDEVARYATEVKREHGLGFSMRMGLHSGEVVVGKIGDDLRMDYTARGHSVGLAQRMERLASPDTCYLTAATAALVVGYFELEDLGDFSVKGVAEPVHVHRLRGLGSAQTRFDVSRARGLTRFVGRDADMEALEAALEQAQAGNGQVVGVVAEAGTGKSRLCFEFVERCRARGMNVLEGHAVAHGKNVPYLPMLQVFRGYYGVQPEDDDRAAREKIAGRMLLLDEAFRDVLPVLFEFFGVLDPNEPPPRMDPDAKQRQLFSVLRRIAQGADPRVNAQNFAALIEDLHWMDSGSEAFLEQWVDAIAGSSSLLIVDFRPEYRADWMQKSYYRQIPLAPLGPEAIRELLDDLLGGDPSTRGLAQTIHARTGGNPFFTEEVVQGLIESGHLEGTRGSYRLVSPIKRLEVPASVHSVLEARIDRLPEREKRVLQTAAVIGEKFAEPILLAATEDPDGELRSALAALEAGEFVYEHALYPVAEYAFKHPLTQEVALDSQLQERRRQTHAAVARAIEEAEVEMLDEQSALLAHHWEEAGEALTAASWHRRAAEWVGRTDAPQAVQHMRKVLTLTEGLEESSLLDELRREACMRLLIQAGWRAGLTEEEAEECFAEGRERVARTSDVDLTIRLYLGYATVLGLGGDARRYHEIARDAFALVDEQVSPGPVTGALVAMAYSSFTLGRIRDALEFADRATPLVEGSPLVGIEIAGFSIWDWSLMMRTELTAHLGRLDAAGVLMRQAIDLVRSHEISDVLAWTLAEPTLIARLSGSSGANPEADEARRLALEGVEVSERIGSHFSRCHAYRVLGEAHLLHGDWAGATETLETALSTARLHRTGLEREAHMLAELSEARLGAGDLASARALAEESVARAKEQGAKYFECWGRLALSRALLADPDADASAEIERHLERALKLVGETEGRALEPQIREERARLAELRGDDSASQRELREAHRLYTEMGATGHAERVARELDS